MLIRKLLVLLALVAVCVVSPCAAQKTAAGDQAKPSDVPQVVVAVQMPTTDLQVTDVKFRVFFNKEEKKAIPLSDFDFAANLGDELTSALSEDKRAQWRVAKPEEKKQLASFFGPDARKKKSFPPPSFEADRVLLVEASYTAFVHMIVHDIEVDVALRLADCKSGKILWKKTLRERMGLPAKLEEMQGDNQKVLKETLNKLMEQIVLKGKQRIAESQI